MPKEVILIAAVTVDGFVARHSLEITSWSKDLQVFKKQTRGFPLILGSNTDKTISSSLKGRRKIVVGRGDDPENTLTEIKEKRCLTWLKKKGFKFPSIISPLAYVSHKAKVGEGTIIMHGAIVNSGAIIGKNCIVNSKSLVEHDAIVGNNSHLSTRSTLNGGVTLGKNCFVGSHAIIKQGVSVGKNTFINANLFIDKNIKYNSKIYEKK